MLFAIPLLIIPFLAYNLVMLGVIGAGGPAALENVVWSTGMPSGATWSMTLGDLLILVALVALFFEILKSTRGASRAIIDHMLSMVLFIVFLVEFLLVRGATTQVFFLLMTVSFIDVIAGFAVSIRSAGRDVSIGL